MAHSWKLIGPGHVCSGRTGPNVSLTKTLQYSHTLMITGMGEEEYFTKWTVRRVVG